jgi:hypothetical protein
LLLFSYCLTCAASIAVVEKRMCMRYTSYQNSNSVLISVDFPGQ